MKKIEVEISPNPKIPSVTRNVSIKGILLNLDQKSIEFFYEVEHKNDKQEVLFTNTSNDKPWIVNNNYNVVVRDKDMKPVTIKNEQGEEIEKTEAAFDNFITLFSPFISVLENYIKLDDEKTHRFDF